jgi:hypothetical protein
MNTLQKHIMRDIYTAFAIHVVTRPIVRYAVGALIALEVIAKMVFVAAVIANARKVGVEQLPQFGVNALTHTNIFTLTALMVLAYLGVAMLREVLKMTHVVPARRFA